jgi:HTH-type transcriptional regulator / antitoxin HigA
MTTTTTTRKKKGRGARGRAAGTGAAVAGATEDYLELVRRLPLRPISTRAEYDRALAVLDELLPHGETGDLAAGEKDYVNVLARLVRDYDEEHSSILAEARKLTPIDMLKYLMEEHQMNTIGLGKLVGGSGQASMILRGKRELSKANIRMLATHFNVSAALFI